MRVNTYTSLWQSARVSSRFSEPLNLLKDSSKNWFKELNAVGVA